MDFKVAGTRAGITALQMDIKISGVTGQIMREALEQARRGRLFLLDKMDEALPSASAEKSKFAPQIHTLQIPTDKIRDLIGPGGKTIRGIIEVTGVKIDVDDTGRVNVASSDEEGLKKAIEMISNLTAVPEIGKTYLGKVVRLAEFGAFIELFPAQMACCTSARDRRAPRKGRQGRTARRRSGNGQGPRHRRQSHQVVA